MQNKTRVSGILFSVPWCHHQLCGSIIVLTLSFYFAFQLHTALSPLEPRGARAGSVPLAGTQHRSLRTHPQPGPRGAAAAPEPGRSCSSPGDPAVPQGPHPIPACGPWLGSRWPGGGPHPSLSEPHGPPKGLSVSKVSRFKSAFLPRPAPAACLRYPCEWRRKRKTQQNLSQMPVLLNIKRLLNSLDVRVSPTKQSF